MASRASSRGRGSPKVPFHKVPNGRIIGSVVFLAFMLVVIHFAFQGGEYSTTDLLRLRGQIAEEQERVDSLEARVERLGIQKRMVESDAATQERIAREEFGMVRGTRELLYRFTDTLESDSSRTP